MLNFLAFRNRDRFKLCHCCSDVLPLLLCYLSRERTPTPPFVTISFNIRQPGESMACLLVVAILAEGMSSKRGTSKRATLMDAEATRYPRSVTRSVRVNAPDKLWRLLQDNSFNRVTACSV
jgi:hypothetical protein